MDMYQNETMISLLDLTVDNNDIWAVTANSNYLIKFNGKEIGLAECVTQIMDEFHTINYVGIEKYKNNIFLIPAAGETIKVYNTESGKVNNIWLREPQDNRKERFLSSFKFHNKYVKDNLLFVFGYFYPAIICIDMDRIEIEYIDDWIDTIEEKIKPGDMRGYFGLGYIETGKYVYFPFSCHNAFLKLNFEDLLSDVVDIPIDFEGFSFVQKIRNDVWVSGRGKDYDRICKYNMDSEDITEVFVETDHNQILDHYLPRWKLYEYKNGVLVFPQTDSNTLFIDLNGKTHFINELSHLKRTLTEYGEIITAFMVKKIGNYVIASLSDGRLIEFDLANDSIKEGYTYISESSRREESKIRIKMMLKKKTPIFEGVVTIEDFIDEIV